MTDEERRVTRHEPITVGEFVAKPLPWRKRNDVGEALLTMATGAFNRLVTPTSDGSTGVNINLIESVLDYDALFLLMYSKYEPRVVQGQVDFLVTPPPEHLVNAFAGLDFNAMIDVLAAGLEVNGLERLVYLLDPDRKKGPTTGESVQPIAAIDDGQRMEPVTDSG